MPLDLRSFRGNPALVQEYKNSQRNRRPSSTAADADNNNGCATDGDDYCRLLDAVLEQDLATRRLLLQVEQCRTKCKRKEMSKLALSEKALAYGQAVADLESNLLRLPNWVDTECVGVVPTGAALDYETLTSTLERGTASIPTDPFFCLGGYAECNTSSTAAVAVTLTGVGVALEAALHQTFLAKLEAQLDPCPTTVYQLPATMALPVAQFEKCWGLPSQSRAATTTIPPASAVTQDAPSWMHLVQQHTDTVYYDRQLPVYMVTSTTSSTQFGGDKRELDRRASWHSHTKKRIPWYQRATVARQVQVTVLTGPSTTADSRPLQLEILQQIKSIYRDFLVIPNAAATLTIRAVRAADLEPAEASRLVLEGRLSNNKIVCLAYISNLCDYASVNLKHGTTQERLHVLQGVVCSGPETLEWILQHGATATGVVIPAVLIQHSGCTALTETLPYRKQVTFGKQGKRTIRCVVSVQDDKEQAEQDAPPPIPMANGLLPPSAAEIRLEAASSPFDFLPFHQT